MKPNYSSTDLGLSGLSNKPKCFMFNGDKDVGIPHVTLGGLFLSVIQCRFRKTGPINSAPTNHSVGFAFHKAMKPVKDDCCSVVGSLCTIFLAGMFDKRCREQI